MLLLKVSAHITEQLGMAPGGEFREAFKEVRGAAGRALSRHGAHWSRSTEGRTLAFHAADPGSVPSTPWGPLSIAAAVGGLSPREPFPLGWLRYLPHTHPSQASKVPFCKFHLGDRPIPVTFKRAIAALSFWQKVKLAWGLCFLSDPIR